MFCEWIHLRVIFLNFNDLLHKLSRYRSYINATSGEEGKTWKEIGFSGLKCRMVSSLGAFSLNFQVLRSLHISFHHITCTQDGWMWQMLHLYLLQNYPVTIYNAADFIILVTSYYLYEPAYNYLSVVAYLRLRLSQ